MKIHGAFIPEMWLCESCQSLQGLDSSSSNISTPFAPNERGHKMLLPCSTDSRKNHFDKKIVALHQKRKSARIGELIDSGLFIHDRAKKGSRDIHILSCKGNNYSGPFKAAKVKFISADQVAQSASGVKFQLSCSLRHGGGSLLSPLQRVVGRSVLKAREYKEDLHIKKTVKPNAKHESFTIETSSTVSLDHKLGKEIKSTPLQSNDGNRKQEISRCKMGEDLRFTGLSADNISIIKFRALGRVFYVREPMKLPGVCPINCCFICSPGRICGHGYSGGDLLMAMMERYLLFIELIELHDLALMCHLPNADLLIFTSTQLQADPSRLSTGRYLWGVFRSTSLYLPAPEVGKPHPNLSIHEVLPQQMKLTEDTSSDTVSGGHGGDRIECHLACVGCQIPSSTSSCQFQQMNVATGFSSFTRNSHSRE